LSLRRQLCRANRQSGRKHERTRDAAASRPNHRYLQGTRRIL